MQLVKLRRSDGLVVATVSVGRNAAIPMPDDEYKWQIRTDHLPTDKAMRRAGNGRFYPVAKKDLIQPRHILAARGRELAATDHWAMPDRTGNAEWLAYRQALRDITENGRTVKAMVKAFPIRPDGTDAISEYR